VQVSRRWGIIFSLLSLFCAIFAGGMLRAALYPAKINSMEDFFHQLFLEVPKSGIVFYISCLMFLVTAALVVFEVVHSCMLQASQILHDDLLYPLSEYMKRRMPKRLESEKSLSKNATLKIYAILAYFGVGVTAIIVEEGIYGAVLEAVIILACGLAPVTLLALHCGRMNLAGTWAGFLSGCTAAAVWDLLKVFPKDGQSGTLKEILGFHGIIPAMAFGLFIGIVVAKLTKAPESEVLEAYDQVKYRYVTSDEEWMEQSQEKLRRIFRRGEE
jgi:Na+/proline symporter